MMRASTVFLLAATLSTPALARDTVLTLPLADVLAMPQAKEKLDGSVKFYLEGQPTPKVLETRGTDTSNKKTNGMGKSDVQACQWAALSALIALQQSAKQAGANAVVNMVSYYKKKEYKNEKLYECHAGSFVVGVALKGTYAKVAAE